MKSMMSEKDSAQNHGFKIEAHIELPLYLEFTGPELEELIERLQFEIAEEKQTLALLEKQLLRERV